ncbi:unnamed protein product [Amoebophrya sp. A25]|nr:unnamed protein product [Amoebophrya sp. A25]CAD7939825.1 unnamed protein product [Amoebophrya sp. A25]|eukprot:GSA25T00006905001.1
MSANSMNSSSVSTEVAASEVVTAASTMVTVASTIEFSANPGKINDAAGFMTVARDAVKQTEPGTKLWFGLKHFPVKELGQELTPEENNEKFGIIDFFVNDEAKAAHFGGEVPKAVKANDESEEPIVKGGLDAIVASAKGWKLLAAPKNEQEKLEKVKFVSYIPFKAGSADQVENVKGLLLAGLGLVQEHESGTPFWAAVQNQEDPEEFAILDAFDDIEAVKAHFVEPAKVPTAVQGALKENPELIKDGWEKGVVANIRVFRVLAVKADL